MMNALFSELLLADGIFLIPSNLAQHSGHFHKTFFLLA
jgi:hypothetical protein